MKKIALFITVLTVFSMTGCGGNDDFEFQGHILEIVDSTSIFVGSEETDPTAIYPAYKILIVENTLFSGEVKQFSDLKIGQSVKISIEGEEELEKMEGDAVATEIFVD
ncbi:hypothetical protein [Metabacillus litoralis]|uniref:hypothetical protein n=1 Tax=Metabacillus litoralis TaxID=152268 RepID=UPI001CFDA268|nr:hypothetical protein [Metabacillus litoralis]